MINRKYQVRIYPTLLDTTHGEVIVKRLIEDQGNLCESVMNQDLIGISQNIAEMMFTLFGLCHTMGLPIESIFDEVYRSKYYKKKANIAAVLKPHIEAKARVKREMEKENASS